VGDVPAGEHGVGRQAARLQYHFDAVRVRGTLRQEAQHDAVRQRACALVLLLDNLHPQAGADLVAFGQGH